MRWKVGLEVSISKEFQGTSKKTNSSQRRNGITGTLLARSKKWKRMHHIYLLHNFFGKSCEERLLGFTTLTITTYLSSLSSLFKECPHPDDKQRMKLSQELGLKPRQVKFWFQNRRTQMKVRMLASRHLMIPTTFSIPFTFMVTLKLASYHACTILEKNKR